LLEFQPYYEQIATPFEGKFTKDDLRALLERIAAHQDAAPHPPHNGPHEYVTEIPCQTTKRRLRAVPAASTSVPARRLVIVGCQVKGTTSELVLP
jgi:hypothetical protein